MVTSILDLLQALPACPACRKRERKKLFIIPHSTVYECVHCRLRYLDPCLSPLAMKEAYLSEETLKLFHDFHEGYYDYGDLTKETPTLKDFRHGLVLLEKCLPGLSTRKIFDVGFGNGFFLAAAQQRGWDVAGIDSSPKNVELAKKKFSLDLTYGDLEDCGNFGEGYDAISFWDVIEHLPEPHLALDKAWKMLKPNGCVLIGLPYDKSALQYLATFLYSISGGKLTAGLEKTYFLEHVSYYHLESLKELFHSQGYQLCDYFFTSTDLDKYHLRWMEKIAAVLVLLLGKLFNRQNRIVAIFKKRDNKK